MPLPQIEIMADETEPPTETVKPKKKRKRSRKKAPKEIAYRLINEWNHVSEMFPIKSYTRPRLAWFNGVSHRLLTTRLIDIADKKGGKTLYDYLSEKSDADVKALRVISAVNHEQAVAGFRTVMVGNVSVPLALIALANQLLPGGIGNFAIELLGGDTNAYLGALLGGCVGIILLVIFTIYALAHLTQARDIKNLIDIYAAQRGIYFGLEDIDDLG